MLRFLSKKVLGHMMAAVAVISLAGCATLSRTDFPVDLEAQAELANSDVHIVRLTPQNIMSHTGAERVSHPQGDLPASAEAWQYFVGVGDVLSITVWDHPELTLPAGEQRSQLESGSSVDAQGQIFYPYIDRVQVSGRTVGQIQQDLSARLSKFIPDPQIEVKVAAFNSQKVVVTGAVNRPGSITVSNIPLTLLEAVNGSGGLTTSADITHVTVQRGGKTYYVHLKSFLATGNHSGNPVLQGGDIVNVPVHENNVAYVLGQIREPGLVDLGNDGLNLTEAITQRGGLFEEAADAQGIFVFRNSSDGGIDVFQLDATTPLAFVLATQFAMHAQDVVYIVADPAAQWNAVIATLAPSISAVRGLQVIEGGF
ncbi:MAG: polysaccharide biosynthesis/export family protein [Rhodobacteraceae bacterium]|nr:polysaccharide biosynthesis/export family protein [Paracoccaceae bacterium]